MKRIYLRWYYCPDSFTLCIDHLFEFLRSSGELLRLKSYRNFPLFEHAMFFATAWKYNRIIERENGECQGWNQWERLAINPFLCIRSLVNSLDLIILCVESGEVLFFSRGDTHYCNFFLPVTSARALSSFFFFLECWRRVQLNSAVIIYILLQISATL